MLSHFIKAGRLNRKILVEREIRRAAELIVDSKYAVALTGAGISTPSGIPDFRSPGTGLWERFDPMSVASIFAFNLHPLAFYEWARPFGEALLKAKPNPAHYALAELEEMKLLSAVITQNIDGLHQKAGSKRVLEVHGHIREATCLKCHKVVPLEEEALERFVKRGEVPHCQCGGILKPNVVLFGEELPRRVLLEAWGEAENCDLMLVAGSSLEVAPASEIPLVAKRYGARLIITNYQPTPLDAQAEVVIHGDVAEVLPRMVEECRKALHRRLRGTNEGGGER